MSKDTIQCPECGSIVEIPKQEEMKNQEDWLAAYAELAATRTDAPTTEDVTEMKEKHGGVYLMPFNKSLWYLYRPVTANEYEELMVAMVKHVGNEDMRLQEKTLNELLVYKCVIYPKITPGNKKDLPAGTIPSLSHLIHMVSNFADPSTLSNNLYQL